MHQPSLLFTALASLVVGYSMVSAQENEWQVDPRPYSERSTRLHEIAVHRYVPQAVTGQILERRYLLTASGFLAPAGDQNVPAGVTIPEQAFGKLLVPASAWLAYQCLGPQALANFRLVNDLEPIDIAGRWQYEVARAEGASGYVGPVVNLSSRADATPGSPLIGGFVVKDIPRAVLLRAVGPGLRPFGVDNAAADTRLVLYRGDEILLTNDSWTTNPSHQTLVEQATARAGAFALTPGSADAAAVIILAPGAYTAQAQAVTPGAVLLEVYLLE